MDSITRDYERSVILNFNHKKLWIQSAPEYVKEKEINFLLFKSVKINYLLAPLLIIHRIFTFATLSLSLCRLYKPRIILTESIYYGIMGGILKRLGFCKKAYNISGDWIIGTSEKGILPKIHRDFVVKWSDYFSCRLNDKTLNAADAIGQARKELWGERCTWNETTLRVPYFELRISPRKIESNTICFLGTIRKDSGLELVLNVLANNERCAELNLLFIGIGYLEDARIYQLVEKLGLTKRVQFVGYVERRDLATFVNKCFCGINLITEPHNLTKYTFPGKVIDYLQHGLPVIATPNIGFMHKLIQDNNLGLIVKPSEEEIAKAIVQMIAEKQQFHDRIVQYIGQSEDFSFAKYLD
jgi:glycosyltransferase involved in cell wall biosynthesis